MISKFLIILGLHYIADFPLQSDFIAKMKGTKLYILFAHAMIYATVISIGLIWLNAFTTWKLIIVLLSHMAIDKWKSNKPKDDAHWYLIYYDQAGHILINTFLLFI